MEDIDETELEEKERELFISVRSDCRYLDGVIYIPDLMIYYYPDRGFVDVNGSRILKSNYGIISGEGAAKKAYHSYEDIQLSKTLYGKYRLVEGKLKNGDTIELEYIENPSKDNFVSAKKVNGVVTTRYIWQADNEMGHYLIKRLWIRMLRWNIYMESMFWVASTSIISFRMASYMMVRCTSMAMMV